MRIKIKIAQIITAVALMNFTGMVQADTTEAQAPLFNNLGDFHYKISTTNPLAQRFFDQGLVLFYGFEWGESIRSFKEAIRLDPQCGMCYWGLALALGNKINAPMNGHEYSDAKAAIHKAQALKKFETPEEQDYIKALSLRYQHAPTASVHSGVFSCHAASGRDHVESTKKEMAAYSAAMKKLVDKYPNDVDAKSIYAFSYYNQIEWLFWDPNHKMNLVTPIVINTLKSALAINPMHAGANHYYVHVIEQSANPADAMVNADHLRTLVPGSEHLVHMPAHIYFLTGKYHEASDSNQQAVAAFQQYYKDCYAQGYDPEINYLYFHNFDFLRTTAVMEGKRDLALSTARKIVDRPFSTWIAKEQYLQWFIPIQYFVEARFAMWPEILKQPKPDEKYHYALGMWHYARGMAYSHMKEVKAAKEESAKLKAIMAKGATDSNLGKSGRDLLKIANKVLSASIANAEGQGGQVISHLKTADMIQHGMGYHEPPDWYFPVKEMLGDAYLTWGDAKNALVSFQDDLKQYPKNGWGLYGLEASLRKLGKTQEADKAQQDFKEAWKGADVTLPIIIF